MTSKPASSKSAGKRAAEARGRDAGGGGGGAFAKWLRDNKVELDGVEVARFARTGRGVRATRDLRVGEVVVSVPDDAVLTVDACAVTGTRFNKFPCAQIPRNDFNPPTSRGSARRRFPAHPNRSNFSNLAIKSPGISYNKLFDTCNSIKSLNSRASPGISRKPSPLRSKRLVSFAFSTRSSAILVVAASLDARARRAPHRRR